MPRWNSGSEMVPSNSLVLWISIEAFLYHKLDKRLRPYKKKNLRLDANIALTVLRLEKAHAMRVLDSYVKFRF